MPSESVLVATVRPDGSAIAGMGKVSRINTMRCRRSRKRSAPRAQKLAPAISLSDGELQNDERCLVRCGNVH